MNAKPGHLTFDITGMTCAACSARVEKVLSRQPGVQAARVNLALERADIDGDSLDPSLLSGAIERAGYGAILRREDFEARREADEAQAALRRADERQTFLRFAVSGFLTLPIVIGMLPMMTGLGEAWISPLWQWLLATGVMAVSGSRFLREAFAAIRGGSANMAVLVSLGTGSAYLWSCYVLVTGASDGSHGMAGHLHFEAAAVVLTLIMLGKWLEARAKSDAAGSLRALARLQPQQAERQMADGRFETVPAGSLDNGDIIRVRPGSRIPADGVIEAGVSAVDESMITGESLPVSRGPGDKVVTGSLNTEGVLDIAVTAAGADTRLARMTRLVEEAQTGHAPVQKLVDRISAVFVPVILVVAAMTLGGWLLTGASFEEAMIPAIAVLVIACPCALGLATPTALVAGTGAAARAGILIRDIDALERATGIRTVAFDKTGTLTLGQPEVTRIDAADGHGEDDLLRLAASLEQASEHPLARAIVERARVGGMILETPHDITAVPGRGIKGRIGRSTVHAGSARFMAEAGIVMPEGDAPEAGSLIFVGRDGAYCGKLVIADGARPEAASALATLHGKSIATIMLTGDNAGTAAAVAEKTGVKAVRASLLPGEKVDAIRALSAETRGHVAFVGDGLNDAAALAAADLGIAMVDGADAAREAAAITLMRPDLRLVPACLDVAERTRRTIRQNLVWAFAYNVVGIPLAAFGILPPVFAGAAMAFSSVSVVTNSALMARWRPAAEER